MHLARPRQVTLALLAATTSAVALSSAAPAQAAGHPKPRPHAQHITVQGVIVAHTGQTVTVFANTLAVGHTKSTHGRVTVTLPVSRKHTGKASLEARTTSHPAALRVGDVLTLNGTGSAAGDAITLTSAQQEVESPAPARAWFGTISAIDPTTHALTLQSQDTADGHHAGEDGVAGESSLAVDVSTASVTLDGAAADTAALTVGQTVVVLGQSDHDAAVGVAVYAYTQAPTSVSGELRAVTGSVVTIGDGQNVDLSPGGTPIPLLLNGNPAATLDQLNEGDKLLVIGAGAGDAFTPTIAFAFNEHDNGPCGTNQD